MDVEEMLKKVTEFVQEETNTKTVETEAEDASLETVEGTIIFPKEAAGVATVLEDTIAVEIISTRTMVVFTHNNNMERSNSLEDFEDNKSPWDT